jgi:hypothetical protein
MVLLLRPKNNNFTWRSLRLMEKFSQRGAPPSAVRSLPPTQIRCFLTGMGSLGWDGVAGPDRMENWTSSRDGPDGFF